MGRPNRPRQPWGNRRRHQDAERVATPQWRSLGPVLVEVCADRLLVHLNGKPGTVWLASVTDVHVDAEHEIVDLDLDRLDLACVQRPRRRSDRQRTRQGSEQKLNDAPSWSTATCAVSGGTGMPHTGSIGRSPLCPSRRYDISGCQR